MFRFISLFLFILITAFSANAQKGKQTISYDNGLFRFSHITLAGLRCGVGPTSCPNGCSRELGVECMNILAIYNYCNNGDDVVPGPNGYSMNPTVHTYFFGVDVPVYNNNRHQVSLTPCFGWEIDEYFSNSYKKKSARQYKETEGFKWSIGVEYEFEVFDCNGIRVGYRYLSNNNHTFCLGFTINKRLK